MAGSGATSFTSTVVALVIVVAIILIAVTRHHSVAASTDAHGNAKQARKMGARDQGSDLDSTDSCQSCSGGAGPPRAAVSAPAAIGDPARTFDLSGYDLNSSNLDSRNLNALTSGDYGQPNFSYGTEVRPQDVSGGQGAEVYKEMSRLYSTADVDPMIVGQQYAYRDNTRYIYDQRTAQGGVWGLQEFSSSGGPGDVGVDVGPYGMAEYGGKSGTCDDGIPADWDLPSTPVRWYKPELEDYVGPDGPEVYDKGLYPLNTQDNDPLIGEDTDALELED